MTIAYLQVLVGRERGTSDMPERIRRRRSGRIGVRERFARCVYHMYAGGLFTDG